MKILLIECDAEELRANRTIMDGITEAISSFTRSFAGFDVSADTVAAAMAKAAEDEEAEEVDGDEQRINVQ